MATQPTSPADIVRPAKTELEVYSCLEKGLQFTIEEKMQAHSYLNWIFSATRFRYNEFEPWKIVFVQRWVKFKLEIYNDIGEGKLNGTEIVKKYFVSILQAENKEKLYKLYAVRHHSTPGAIKQAWKRISKGTK